MGALNYIMVHWVIADANTGPTRYRRREGPEIARETGFDDMLEFLARRPRAGRIIQGTGGLRKVRIARPGKGKSGGTRVIYYYHNDTKPILLLLIYAKARQDNLTDSQKAQLKKHVEAIIDEFAWETNDGQQAF